MNPARFLLTALPLSVLSLAGLSLALPAWGGPATSEGFAERAAACEFYIEVPMVDDTELADYGVGRNIVAESIINCVRYAAKHPDIRHVVFKMDTGGGALHHAEAMQDVIERHHVNMEYHIVVQNAISAGIWTAFSCDSIFMCPAGTIGGATAYFRLSEDTVMVADDIPQIAGRLAITAKRNGYPPQLIEPLMLMKTELYTWIGEDGERKLEQERPDNADSLQDFKTLDRKDTVLTLTSNDAVMIGIAKPIDRFDASLVGDKLGVRGWTRANRYGQVIDDIGELYNTTRVMEDQWVERQLSQPRFPVTPQNRNNRMITEMRENRAKYVNIVEALRTINASLNELPDVHPERHIYFAGEDGKTIVADPEQWEEDSRFARMHAGKLNEGIDDLLSGYRAMEIDADELELVEKQTRAIIASLIGISSKGNATYWAQAED